MSKSSLHSCGTCTPNEEGQTDCAVCKLAFLNEARREQQEKKKSSPSIDDDDYSISERLTENKGDHTIWLLVAVGALLFIATIGFTILFR